MFTRKTKEDKPVVAICYDFDKTLSPNDMQAQGYIQSVGYDVDEFWKDSNSVAFANEMDQNLAYMYKMVDEARGRFVFNRQALMDYGSKVELFKGVEEWFDRIRQYGAENGVIVEHYIISSGLKEMIEGTSIAKKACLSRFMPTAFTMMTGAKSDGQLRLSIIQIRHSSFSESRRACLIQMILWSMTTFLSRMCACHSGT